MKSQDLTVLTSDLLEILGSYANLTPPNFICLPSSLSFASTHNFFLQYILLDPHFQAYPPSTQYQLSFWKWAISNLESRFDSEDDEIDQRIYDHYVSLMPISGWSQSIGDCPPISSFVTYIWNQDSKYQTGTLLESRTTIESGTTGLKTWLASLYLADYLLSRPELVSLRNVLELGSGAGLLGIVTASLQLNIRENSEEGQFSLILSDVRQDVLRRCQDNLALPCNESSLHPRLQYLTLDWMDALDVSQQSTFLPSWLTRDVDIVLGADVVYDPNIIPALVATLVLLLEPSTGQPCNKIAFIALTIRNPATTEMFLEVARCSLSVQEVFVDRKYSAFVGVNEKGMPFNNQDIKIYHLEYPNAR